MKDPRTEFELALLVQRVARRFAMEHDTEEDLKKYLQEHPGADRSQHRVKPERFRDRKAPKGPETEEARAKRIRRNIDDAHH